MSALEALVRRDRAVTLAGLAAVTALAWAWMLAGAGMDMGGGKSMGMGADMVAARMAWTPAYAAVIFFMWWVMMAAMMLPSAAPAILLFARISRQRRAQAQPFAPAGAFAAGYLLVWGAFSLAATLLQWALVRAGLVGMMMESVSVALSAVILIAAGVWQFTPLKRACLLHCRSPLHFVLHGFRPGVGGALRMGVEHGLYCTGCCWFLMALLFYGGVMNLWWIAGLALYILIEKVAPYGETVAKIAGAGLIAWGVLLIGGVLTA